MHSKLATAVLKHLKTANTRLNQAKTIMDIISSGVVTTTSAFGLKELIQRMAERKRQEEFLQRLIALEEELNQPKKTEKTASVADEDKKQLIANIVEKQVKLAEYEDPAVLAQFTASLVDKSVEELKELDETLARKLAMRELEFGKVAEDSAKTPEQLLEEFLLYGRM